MNFENRLSLIKQFTRKMNFICLEFYERNRKYMYIIHVHVYVSPFRTKHLQMATIWLQWHRKLDKFRVKYFTKERKESIEKL